MLILEGGTCYDPSIGFFSQTEALGSFMGFFLCKAGRLHSSDQKSQRHLDLCWIPLPSRIPSQFTFEVFCPVWWDMLVMWRVSTSTKKLDQSSMTMWSVQAWKNWIFLGVWGSFKKVMCLFKVGSLLEGYQPMENMFCDLMRLYLPTCTLKINQWSR